MRCSSFGKARNQSLVANIYLIGSGLFCKNVFSLRIPRYASVPVLGSHSFQSFPHDELLRAIAALIRCVLGDLRLYSYIFLSTFGMGICSSCLGRKRSLSGDVCYQIITIQGPFNFSCYRAITRDYCSKTPTLQTTGALEIKMLPLCSQMPKTFSGKPKLSRELLRERQGSLSPLSLSRKILQYLYFWLLLS